MFADCWEREHNQAQRRAMAYRVEAEKAEKDIQKLVDKIVDTENVRVIEALERRIDEHETRKTLALEKAQGDVKPIMPMEKIFELSMKYLKAPYLLWESGRLDLRRLVLKLTFSEHLRYRKGSGFELSPFSLPFQIVNQIKQIGDNVTSVEPAFAEKCEMVPRGGTDAMSVGVRGRINFLNQNSPLSD